MDIQEARKNPYMSQEHKKDGRPVERSYKSHEKAVEEVLRN
jgi:hypothetical protein